MITAGGKHSLILQTSDEVTTLDLPFAGGRLKVMAPIPGVQPVKQLQGNQGEELQ